MTESRYLNKITREHGKKGFAGKGEACQTRNEWARMETTNLKRRAFIETRCQSCSAQTRVRDPRRIRRKVEGV